MPRLTANNIVRAIAALPRDRDYTYANERTHTVVRIISITEPEGPISVKRWDPTKGQTANRAKAASISRDMIWRLANSITENTPVNLERVYASSYNLRSALEALLVHTPQFYFCYPGRIVNYGDASQRTARGHKHIIWLPDEPHQNGLAAQKNVENMAVSELPTRSVVYDSITLPTGYSIPAQDLPAARRHAQIQILLYLIGKAIGHRTWIAANDHGIVYQGTPLRDCPGIIPSLTNDTEGNLIKGSRAEHEARLIDCIWLHGLNDIPAVMEVEHSTGVTSGLDRMRELSLKIPRLETIRYVIVAPDEDRTLVQNRINQEQFRDLKAKFFPYSAVEELYYLSTTRNLKGANQSFIDSFMEDVFIL